MRISMFLAAGLVGLSATAAVADDFSPAMQAYFEDHVAGWINDPVIVTGIKAQNAKTGSLSQSVIDSHDATWRAQVGLGDRPMVQSVLDTPGGAFLREKVAASGGVITEVFTMDQQGLNVAASTATSDYWQGDEAKFQQTFGQGPGSVHVSDVEFDESTQTYSAQVSAVIVDPATGAPIGAVTVGLNAEALM